MCGICGFFQLERRGDKRTLVAMNQQIIHRGPDDDGYFYQNHIGLAARRLSIIDLHTGHQPLCSQSGNSWIAYNGEVYNFKELRQDLQFRGFSFKTKSDTEVIVNLYEAFGMDFVKKLRGMFAVAIYDQAHDRLLLARDHIGIKPLYYYLDPGSKNLVFASEIKSILQYPGVVKCLDHEALDHFLTLEYIPAPFSLFKHIRKLPAAHLLIYEGGRLKLEQYWDLEERQNPTDFNQLKEEFLALLKESVTMRMISDVPLGAFLSGGIDSSAIVGAMSRFSSDPVKTFSIGFEEKSYSELEHSETVSRYFHTDHHTRTLTPDIEELVLYLADFWDEPLADFSNFPTYLVSKIAREKVTVVLSGDGGDEIFGGYEHYIAQKIARWIDPLILRPFHPLLAMTTHLFPPSDLKKGFVNRIKRFSEGLASSHLNRHFRWMFFLSALQKKKLYTPDFLAKVSLGNLPQRTPFDKHFEHAGRCYQGINQDLYLDFKTYLVDNILVKVDRMSMATSLEARVPLLDYKLVEFAFSLPPDYKVRGSTTKWFFKKALSGFLPETIINRRKEGFSIPIKNWLKGELKELMLTYLDPSAIESTGLFENGYVQRLISEHLASKENHSHRLWALISFMIWKKKFLS